MARWLAVACVAAAIAAPLPGFAQPFAFRAAQQKRAFYQARPAQVRPRAQQAGHAGDWLRRYKDMPAGEQERSC